MSKLKKLGSILLALVFAIGMTCTALAVDTYSITVTGNEGETYTAYKVLDATVSGTNVAYTIANDSVWYNIVNASGSPFDVTQPAGSTTTSVVTLKDKKTADDIATYFASVTLPTDAAVAATGKIATDAETVTLNVTSSGAGYYYVTTTLGSVVNLTSASPTAEIEDKNTVPVPTKKVLEDSTNTYGTSNTASLGEVVTYQATIDDLGDATKLTLHDEMDDGLTFGSVTSVTLNGTEVDSGKYEVTSTNLTDDCTFEVKFNDTYITGLDDKDVIVVTYTATVNKNAVTVNENDVYVSYGDASKSEKSTTKTYVYEFDLYKYYVDDNGDKVDLDNAEFSLKDSDDNPISLVEVTGGYRVATSEDANPTTTIVAGTVNIYGLDAGTYTLTETKAPSGYNLLSSSITVVIDQEGNVTYTAGTVTGSGIVNVENKAGTILPSTGGIGTTIFYVVGGVLVAGAVVLLITKKRMKE